MTLSERRFRTIGMSAEERRRTGTRRTGDVAENIPFVLCWSSAVRLQLSLTPNFSDSAHKQSGRLGYGPKERDPIRDMQYILGRELPRIKEAGELDHAACIKSTINPLRS